MINIDISVKDPRWSELNLTFVKQITQVSLERHLGQAKLYEICLVLTNDAEIRALNASWCGKDRATNVLSFPACDALEDEAERDFRENVFESGPPVLIGDVCLAYETVASEAEDRSLNLLNRTAHLVVHGLLHLLGFDHETDVEAERMEVEEDAILNAFDIAANRE